MDVVLSCEKGIENRRETERERGRGREEERKRKNERARDVNAGLFLFFNSFLPA